MSKKKGCDSSGSPPEKGKPIKMPDQEQGDLLPLATKTIGMEFQDIWMGFISRRGNYWVITTASCDSAPIQAPSWTAAAHC